jgi:hypothetical protein
MYRTLLTADTAFAERTVNLKEGRSSENQDEPREKPLFDQAFISGQCISIILDETKSSFPQLSAYFHPSPP